MNENPSMRQSIVFEANRRSTLSIVFSSDMSAVPTGNETTTAERVNRSEKILKSDFNDLLLEIDRDPGVGIEQCFE